MKQFWGVTLASVLAVPVVLGGLVSVAWADEAACLARFTSLVVDGTPERGPVRIHVFQEVGGMKTENYFHSPGNGSGDGMTEPLKNMGPMWVLFRDKKMYTSMDKGTTWSFVRTMDDAAQPEAYKQQVRQDLATAKAVACGQESIDGVTFETVEGEYNSTGLQGAVSFQKYWLEPDTGHVAKTEMRSDGAVGKFYSLQIIESAPDFQLPTVE